MKMPSPAGSDRPFPNVPAGDRYLAIGSIEDARSRICKMIDRREGLGVIIGPPGTGKTLLCQRIASQYRATHAVVMLGDIRVSSRAGLIQQLLFHLRVPQQGLDEQAMQLALVECLTKGNDGTRSLLLLIDEAQMLSLDLLDEIRMLTNLVREGRPLVQTVLVGGPRLEDPLADPQLESLSQRIAARCYLHPMTYAESTQYSRSMLAATGMRVEDDAIGSVHHACGGVPRLMNQLMNHAFDFATSQHQRIITDACVQQAWADLQQLPSPMLEPRLKPHREIEFGELDSDTIRTSSADEGCTMASHDYRSDMVDFATCTQPGSTRYVDIEAILASPIVCLPDGSPVSQPAAYGEAGRPLSSQATSASIKPAALAHKQVRKANREELFGIDFSDELLVDVKLTEAVTKNNNAIKATQRAGVDPAADEAALHAEILQMSQSAIEARDADVVPARVSLPWAPSPRIAAETIEALPVESSDIAIPMAIVWSDDEPVQIASDDRDILVIEDEVTVMVDPPSASRIGNAAMRKPGAQADQQYQSLFSRLRTGQ